MLHHISISQEEHSRIVQNFKDFIREQDRQLAELRRKNEELEKKLQQAMQELNNYKSKTASLVTIHGYFICKIPHIDISLLLSFNYHMIYFAVIYYDLIEWLRR